MAEVEQPVTVNMELVNVRPPRCFGVRSSKGYWIYDTDGIPLHSYCADVMHEVAARMNNDTLNSGQHGHCQAMAFPLAPDEVYATARVPDATQDSTQPPAGKDDSQ